MRCLKSRYLSDFKLANLSGNVVSEQVYFIQNATCLQVGRKAAPEHKTQWNSPGFGPAQIFFTFFAFFF